jgi:hypothetical protein
LKRLQKEREEEEEKEAKKKAAEEAVKEFQRKEIEKREKEKKEREQREKEYKERLEAQLVKSGLPEDQIKALLEGKKVTKEEKDKQKQDQLARPTYTRMARRYLSIETLNVFRIDFTLDQVGSRPPHHSQPFPCTNSSQDPDYVLIKRWVPEHEQDALWEHTKNLRERRRALHQRTETKETILMIEDGKRHRRQNEVHYEFVKKHKKRDKSPAPGLITFLAGGKR